MCTKMAAVSHGMSHVTKSALSTLLWWLFKTHSVKVQSVFQNHKQLKEAEEKTGVTVKH